jgi:putative transposase
MIRTYKYRLRPDREQTQRLDTLFCQARKLYNAALEQRIIVYQETGQSIHYPAQWAHFREKRNNNVDTFRMRNATSIQQKLRRLDKAFCAFFPLRFYLQNIGELKVIYHRPIPKDAVFKDVVVKRVNSKWYICLKLELPDPQPKLVPTGKAIGTDMGLQSLLAASAGDLFANPRWLRRSLAQLRIAQRRVSRRKKCSQRWYKAARQVARLHEKITNQCSDYWHKLTRDLDNAHALIAVEDLNLKCMQENKQLSLSWHDAGSGILHPTAGIQSGRNWLPVGCREPGLHKSITKSLWGDGREGLVGSCACLS